MVTSTRAFLIELYQEHLEEASFLYEQRLALFEDPEVTWEDLHDFEERFEAHIDGLVVGGGLALEVCKIRASEGDFAERHAAVRVFYRLDRKDLVLRVLEEIDPEDTESLQAISDALKHEYSGAWYDEFVQMLVEGDQKLIPIFGTLFGFRRLPTGKELLKVLGEAPADSLSMVIWALGRLGEQDAREQLFTYLQHQDESVRSAAALSLLRLGDQQTIPYCLQAACSQNWPLIPLALGGSRAAINLLLELARSGEAEAECLLALGLLGDISAIAPLLTYLSYSQLANASAVALQLITGARLYEEVFIPEEFDEDELFDEEREKLRHGQVSTGLDGQPFGSPITRCSINPDHWHQWWTEHSSDFEPTIRYRNGQPYSPACLLENLQFEYSPHNVRQYAYEELVIRYGIDFSFEADMIVVEQKEVLADIARWVYANESRFQKGAWYFAGKLTI